METAILTYILILFIVFLFGVNLYDRRASRKREDDLISAVMAKNLSEHVLASEHLKPTVREKLKKVKEENKLALKAEKMEAEKSEEEEGIPVT